MLWYSQMTIDDIIYENLIYLLNKYGGATAVARECAKRGQRVNAVYLGQVKNKVPTKSGTARSLGKSATKALSLGVGEHESWMTTRHVFSDGEICESNVSPITKKDGSLAIVGTVPLVSWVQAGEWADVFDNYNVGDAEEMMLCPVNHSPNTFALRVEGDSMTNPMAGHRSYPHGTIIYIDPSCHAELGDRVVAKLDDDNKATFKVLAEDAGQRFLKPLNPQYRNLPINGNCHIVGKVIGAFTPE